MPELPDVEATRHYLLSQGMESSRFLDAALTWPRSVREPSPEEFIERLKGRTVRELARRAKFLLFRLDDGHTLILHLRMTGSLLLEPATSPPPSMVRTTFRLDGGRELRFLDPRKLGVLWLVDNEAPVLGHLGPEPLEREFTPEVLHTALSRRSAPIKALLLEQELVAGIGNIYADEVLWCVGLEPMSRGSSLTPADCECLWECIRKVLAEATERLVPLMPTGQPPTESELGSQVLRVPRSEGAPCPHCGEAIVRLPVRSRSSFFCPRCQAGHR